MYSPKFHPYKGNEPYIFISYSHKDIDAVLPVVAQMAADGYRIWYDEGITPGSEWDDEIAIHIDKCDSFIAFISNNYLKSENCRDELNFVRDLGKERLLIYIEEVTLPPGMAMRLNRLQDVRLYNYVDNISRFYEKLYMAEMLKKSKAAAIPDTGSSSGTIRLGKPQPIPASLFGAAPKPTPILTPPPSLGFTTTIPRAAFTTSDNYALKNHIVDSRYTLGEKIGGGGMATVYKAVDNQTKKIVAVKFYRKYSIENCPFFTEEAIHNIIMKLNHPSLCKILDSDEIGEPYLVTEYVDGITIGDYIQENNHTLNLSFKELLSAYKQILEALFLLHRNNLFYGDVSPFNVMLSNSKQAVLVDYTECNFIGSPRPDKTLIIDQFLSPEKLSADFIDHRSDIFEVGALFEKMLQKYMNSSRTFHSDNMVDVYATPAFDIVRKATKQKPEERYQSVLEMIEAINQLIHEYC